MARSQEASDSAGADGRTARRIAAIVVPPPPGKARAVVVLPRLLAVVVKGPLPSPPRA